MLLQHSPPQDTNPPASALLLLLEPAHPAEQPQSQSHIIARHSTAWLRPPCCCRAPAVAAHAKARSSMRAASAWSLMVSAALTLLTHVLAVACCQTHSKQTQNAQAFIN